MSAIELSSGITIGYEEQGEGDAVVLIPGTGVDHGIFVAGEQLATLAKRYRTIGMDHRGTGESSRDVSDYTIETMADDVIGLLDAVGVERSHVLGVSMGAAIAQHAAIRHPERVASLVLFSPWAHTDEYLRRLFGDIWHFIYSTAEPEFAGKATLWWLLSPEFINGQPGVVDQIARDVFAAPTSATRETLLQHVKANLGHDARDRLADIRCPALVVAGDGDRVIPPSYSEAVASRIPGARLEVLTGPGAGHALFLERAGEVNDLTVEFLTDIQ